MNRWKIVGLTLAAGTLMQFSGCAGVLRDFFISTVATQALDAIIGIFTTPLREALDAAANGA